MIIFLVRSRGVCAYIMHLSIVRPSHASQHFVSCHKFEREKYSENITTSANINNNFQIRGARESIQVKEDQYERNLCMLLLMLDTDISKQKKTSTKIK